MGNVFQWLGIERTSRMHHQEAKTFPSVLLIGEGASWSNLRLAPSVGAPVATFNERSTK